MLIMASTQRLCICLVLFVCFFIAASHSIAQSTIQRTPLRPNHAAEASAVICWSKQIEDEDFRSIRKNINRDFFSIAVPAFLQQVAVPIADLIDSTFLSKLNPEALGGVGVARTSQVRSSWVERKYHICYMNTYNDVDFRRLSANYTQVRCPRRQFLSSHPSMARPELINLNMRKKSSRLQ